ncbi:hypothetical protein SLE2022_251910 [Rubroshorea leprosula]
MDLVTLIQQFFLDLVLIISFHPFIFSFLLLWPLFYLLKLSRNPKLRLPPSPPKLPILGNLHQLGKLPHQSLWALSEKYGPIMLLYFGSIPTAIVSSEDLAQEVLKKNDIAFAERHPSKAAKVFSYGCTNSVFSPYGEYWRQLKKISVVELLNQSRVEMFQFAREEEVGKMVEKIQFSCLNEAAINLKEMLFNFSNNIISRSALGKVYGKESGHKNLGEQQMDAMGAFCLEDLFPCLGWMDFLTGFRQKLKCTFEAIDHFLDQVIEEHKLPKNDGEKSNQKNFLDILLNLQKDGNLSINLTQDNIKAIILGLFVGGTHIVAATMEWAMAELMKNPSEMRKAQEEVRRVVGKKQKVTDTDISQMEYLKCIIKETLRLHTNSLLVRHARTKANLGGYDICPGTRVLINVYAIQRDTKFWDKPGEFHPERFSNNEVTFRGDCLQYFPFGSGRRMCSGISFGVAEVECVLANLLYWFDWKLPNGAAAEDLDMSESFAITVVKKIPLQLVPVSPVSSL